MWQLIPLRRHGGTHNDDVICSVVAIHSVCTTVVTRQASQALIPHVLQDFIVQALGKL